MVLITVLATGLSAFLNFGKFAATLAEQESARFALVAQGVRAGVEANLNLGLQLNGLAMAQSILDRERMVVPETLAVLVFANDGGILYATGTPLSVERAPAEWRRSGDWSAETPAWRVVGTALTNPYGAQVGGVAVVYPRDRRDRTLAAMEGDLLAAAAVAALASALAAAVGLHWLLRRMHREIERAASELSPASEPGDDIGGAVKRSAADAHAAVAELSVQLAPPKEPL